MRNDPPISTSSPRETITSPPSASVFSASRTAAALLLTTIVETCVRLAASALPPAVARRKEQDPSLSCASNLRKGDRHEHPVCRARLPLYRIRDSSNTPAVSRMCCSADSASGARPRFVCRITPVALISGRSECLAPDATAASIAPAIPASARLQRRGVEQTGSNLVPQARQHGTRGVSDAAAFRARPQAATRRPFAATSSTDGSSRNSSDCAALFHLKIFIPDSRIIL